MSNKFCRLLSNGYKINIENGSMMWRPCCFYSKKTNINDDAVFEKELAYTSSATGWIPECKVCYDMEHTEIPDLSPRIASFQKVPEDFADGDCVSLEISFDTRCNAACVMCGPHSSSTWSKFNKKHGLWYIENETSADAYLSNLIERVPMDKLRTVFMMGGEPLFSDTHVKLMEHILAVHPCPDQIVLRYQTNGSIFPAPEVLSLWSKFGSVILNFSIDAIGEQFDYLRWPLKWDNVQENIRRFVDEKFSNIKIGFTATLTPINFWYYDDVVEWFVRYIPETRWRVPELTGAVKPNRAEGDPLDLDRTPMALRHAFLLQSGEDHPVCKIFNMLPDNSAKHLDNMISHTDRIDRLRGLYWRDIFPDVVKFFPPPIV